MDIQRFTEIIIIMNNITGTMMIVIGGHVSVLSYKGLTDTYGDDAYVPPTGDGLYWDSNSQELSRSSVATGHFGMSKGALLVLTLLDVTRFCL